MLILVNDAVFNCLNIKIFTQRSMVQKYDEIQDIKSDCTLNVVVKQIIIKSVFVVS